MAFNIKSQQELDNLKSLGLRDEDIVQGSNNITVNPTSEFGKNLNLFTSSIEDADFSNQQDLDSLSKFLNPNQKTDQTGTMTPQERVTGFREQISELEGQQERKRELDFTSLLDRSLRPLRLQTIKEQGFGTSQLAEEAGIPTRFSNLSDILNLRRDEIQSDISNLRGVLQDVALGERAEERKIGEQIRELELNLLQEQSVLEETRRVEEQKNKRIFDLVNTSIQAGTGVPDSLLNLLPQEERESFRLVGDRIKETKEKEKEKTKFEFIKTDFGNLVFNPMTGESRPAKDVFTEGGFIVNIPESSRLAFVNNNPGNLRFNNQEGASPEGEGGFAKFDTAESGFTALKNDLLAKFSKNSPAVRNKLGRDAETLFDVVSVFAPKEDGNDPVSYSNNVANDLNISPDEPVENLLNRIDELTSSFAKQESNTTVNAKPRLKDLRLEATKIANDIFKGVPKEINVRDIQDRLSKGQTRDEIERDITGIDPEFSDVMLDVASNVTKNKTKDKTEELMKFINRNIIEGDFESIKERVKEEAFNELGVNESNKIRGTEKTLEFIKNIEKDLKEYEDKGGDTNIFKGTTERMVKNVGAVVDQELSKIGNKIALAIQNYRQRITGAAFNELEAKEYKDIFPNIDKTKELNFAKIKALKEVMSADVEFSLRSQIGNQGYDFLFKDFEEIENNFNEIIDKNKGQMQTEKQNANNLF